MFRRNQIVWHEVVVAYSVPARVVKYISENEIIVINTLGRLSTVSEDKLKNAIASDVERLDQQRNVRSRFPVIHRMPSLRKLKQAASWYYSDIWKKPKSKKRLRLSV